MRGELEGRVFTQGKDLEIDDIESILKTYEEGQFVAVRLKMKDDKFKQSMVGKLERVEDEIIFTTAETPELEKFHKKYNTELEGTALAHYFVKRRNRIHKNTQKPYTSSWWIVKMLPTNWASIERLEAEMTVDLRGAKAMTTEIHCMEDDSTIFRMGTGPNMYVNPHKKSDDLSSIGLESEDEAPKKAAVPKAKGKGGRKKKVVEEAPAPVVVESPKRKEAAPKGKAAKRQKQVELPELPSQLPPLNEIPDKLTELMNKMKTAYEDLKKANALEIILKKASDLPPFTLGHLLEEEHTDQEIINVYCVLLHMAVAADTGNAEWKVPFEVELEAPSFEFSRRTTSEQDLVQIKQTVQAVGDFYKKTKKMLGEYEIQRKLAKEGLSAKKTIEEWSETICKSPHLFGLVLDCASGLLPPKTPNTTAQMMFYYAKLIAQENSSTPKEIEYLIDF